MKFPESMNDLQAPESLLRIHQACWEQLQMAVNSTSSGWRTPVLATVSQDRCRQRTVILRSVCQERLALQFHTDIRSSKISQIIANPHAALLFYDHALQMQLQITGRVSIHTSDELADACWVDGTSASLKAYLAPLAPGIVRPFADINLPEIAVGRIPERSEIEAGRVHFAVLELIAETAEWLRLSRDGNVRARFHYEIGQLVEKQWLAP